ncbi:MAG: ABC transporter permease [Armatimonadota bacterium]|nr:ABC transporter permease [Armatimonadota bacterium]MDR7437207.1 ABC transporter permease [Armatimonadota bacterium]MDR7473007.1 ABC transporter permease [Armatimonadota bacterium]MDR7506195.1 ABC transporter permease [Armatimonadota bacterium]MDR7509100.1 ABC transporter permease [Armatimonadota bacterium]
MRDALAEIRRIPAAVAGLAIIGLLVLLSVYAAVRLPLPEAVRLWQGGEDLWLDVPRNAWPAWTNWIPGTRRRAATIVVDSRRALRRQDDLGGGVRQMTADLAFAYPYQTPPPELSAFLEAEFSERAPHVALAWRFPDGRQIPLAELTVDRRRYAYRMSATPDLRQQLGGPPEAVLFADPARPGQARPGRYALEVSAFLFEPEARLDARLVVYGEVYGIAGTDHQRRDLTVALLWGTPVALAFGLLAAVGSTVSTLIIAAVGVWYGGWVDGLIQRITEVNLILPVLPILIMIGTLYSRSIWAILGAVILLGVFGAGIKTYRALFLQVKETPYIEAARAYGVRGLRMVFTYMIPRAIPVLIPQFVTLIPAFVFLEATLAVLGLGDPVLPTWGKVLEDAYRQGALYTGHYYWVLQPAALLMLSGLAFTMLGYALDRIFNPRLREM